MSRHGNDADEEVLGDHRALLVVGIVGLLAVALALGAWWILSAGPSIGKGASALTTARVTVDAAPNPTAAVPGSTETFVVPTPSFVTPTLGIALGGLEPEIPGETPTTTLPTRSSSSSSGSSSSSSSSGAVSVRNVSLSCGLQGRRVRAVLTFFSTGPVRVSLTAADRTESTVGSGNVRLDVIGTVPGQGTATCSARINGTLVGPITAQ